MRSSSRAIADPSTPRPIRPTVSFSVIVASSERLNVEFGGQRGQGLIEVGMERYATRPPRLGDPARTFAGEANLVEPREGRR